MRRVGLLATAALTAAVAAGLVTRHKHTLHAARLADLRHTGFAAATAGDDSGAIAALAPYVAECPADAAAATRYARSRAAVDQPDGQNLRTALLTLNAVLRQSPHDADARDALLELMPRTDDTDTLDRLADEALADDARDPMALRARVVTRQRQGRTADALAAAIALAAATPDDLDAHRTVLRLMGQSRRTAADLAAYSVAPFAAADPRRRLLEAVAAALAGNEDAAVAALHAAAALPAPVGREAETTLALVGAFDELRCFDDARRTLTVAARDGRDPRLLRALALRLWEGGRALDIVQGLAGFDPNDPMADPQLLALRAIALFDTGHATDAQALVTTLAARHDRRAAAWAAAINARYETNAAPAARIAALTRAAAKDPAHPVFQAWLADALTSAGEPGLALDHWTRAAVASPAWAAPHAGRCAALLALGDPLAAADAAQAAFERGPTVPAAVRVVAARFAVYEQTADPVAAAELLDATARVQAAQRFEPTTLAIRVTLLARLGRRDEAAAALTAADAKTLDAAGLLTLAQASAAEALGVERRLLALAPSTPAVALARAAALASAGHPDAGVALLLAESGATPPTDDTALAWPIALAQYASLTHAPDAAARWHALQAAHPDRPDVQRLVAAADPAAAPAAIACLRDIAGDDGQQWKLARACVLTAGPGTDNAAEAIALLSDLVRQTPRVPTPHLELARVLRRTGNVGSALEQARLARQLAPRDPRPLAVLVRLLQEQGQGEEAMAQLRRAAAAPALSVAQRVALAGLTADAGDRIGAARLLADVPAAACVASGSPAASIDAPSLAASPVESPSARLAAWIARIGADPERSAEADALRDAAAAGLPDAWPALREAAARFGADLPLQGWVADYALANGDVEAALAAGRRAVAARPADPAALALPVAALRAGGRWAELRAAADRWAVALGDAPLDADVAAAEALLGLGRPADAAARLAPHAGVLRAAAAARPWPAIVAARVAVAGGDAAAALAGLRDGLANPAVRTAARAIARRDLAAADATAWLDAVDRATPPGAAVENVATLAARAAVARRCGDAAMAGSALAAVDALAVAGPGVADAERVRADLLQLLGRPNAAIAALRTVLDHRPGDAAAHNDLACLLLDTRGDLAEAATLAAAAVAAVPTSAQFHDTLGRVEAERGHRERAAAEYAIAVRLDPRLASAVRGLAGMRETRVSVGE